MPIAEKPKKTERVPVKFTPEQKAMLTRLADAEGETLSSTLRRLVRNEAARRGLTAHHPGGCSCQEHAAR